jgi:hypothetical protein
MERTPEHQQHRCRPGESQDDGGASFQILNPVADMGSIASEAQLNETLHSH